MTDLENFSNVDELLWHLDDLGEDDKVLKQALSDLHRVRQSAWVEQDLPRALDDLLEALCDYQWNVGQITKILHQGTKIE
jgi:hypothetical protein